MSNPDIDKAVETANDLVSQLKAIQTSAETDTYSLGDIATSTPNSESSSSSFDMSDYNSEPALEPTDLSPSISVPETSNALTDNSLIPLVDLSTRETVNVPLSSIKSQLNNKNRAMSKRNPNNQYANALSKINGATTIEQVQAAVKSTVTFKNGKIMGGKTKKRKMMKRRRTMRR